MYVINPQATHQQAILLISGWGYRPEAWPAAWLNALQTQFRVYCVDMLIFAKNEGPENCLAISRLDKSNLPSVTAPASTALATLIKKIMATFNEAHPVHLLGWSLGGQIAWYMAQMYPHHIASVITLASNPCFIKQPDWPYAMDKSTLMQFAEAYHTNPQKTLKRFVRLQVQGSKHANLATTLLPYLWLDRSHTMGLQWLTWLDSRQAWHTLACPSLAVLAEQDALVPVGLASSLQACGATSSQVMTLPACHAIAFEYPQTDVHNPLWQTMQTCWQGAYNTINLPSTDIPSTDIPSTDTPSTDTPSAHLSKTGQGSS